MTVYGIDVASYQSSAYATGGLGFVFVKATEGTGYVNPRHADQIATGRAHNLVVGHYHFVRPGPMPAQAAYFLQHAAPKAGDVLALDWEDTGVSGADKDAWIKRVQAAAPGHRVVLYCNRDFWLNRDRTGFYGDGLWIADPEAPVGRPRVKGPWLIHQYGGRGIDLDVADFPDGAALRAWAARTPPSPAPHPVPHPGPVLTLTKRVSVRVLAWTATHSLLDEQQYPQNRGQVWTVQNALVLNGRLQGGHFIPGIFDSPTAAAYKAEQRAQHYTGDAADGVPGRASLTHLGKQHGFAVMA